MISLKKILPLFVLLFLPSVILNISAEESKGLVAKGNFLLSGMVNVSNYSYSDLNWWDNTVKINVFTIDGTASFLGFIAKGIGLGCDFQIGHQEEKDDYSNQISLTRIGIGPKVAYFFAAGKIYPFLSFGEHYLNCTADGIVADGFRLKFVGGICAPFSGNAVFFIEAGYLYSILFYSASSFSEGITYLGLGIGGFITQNKR